MRPLKRFVRNLRTSFWFAPTLIVVFSIVLAVVMVEADSAGRDPWLGRWPRVFGADADGARAMLSTIAGSMMAIVGITFSMTLVTLALASSQYSSRILRNFIRDRVTQVVLGIFAGVFTYCLIVLRTIRGGDEAGFVASAAVTLGVALAIGGIAVLIYFIHHVASSIQASSIIASVADETIAVADRLYPLHQGRDASPAVSEEVQPLPPQLCWQVVCANSYGYIEGVDLERLLHLAREHDTIVKMEQRIGKFVIQGSPLASLALLTPPDDTLIAAVRNAYSLGRHRTLEQDLAFGVRQIVDVALRALSPSMNDSTTAVMCVDYLTAILARLASRDVPSLCHYEDGKLRLIEAEQSFAHLVAEAFDQIRGSAGGNIAVMLRLLGSLQAIASQTPRLSQRQALLDQVQWIAELADRTIESPHDRARFESRLTRVRGSLHADLAVRTASL